MTKRKQRSGEGAGGANAAGVAPSLSELQARFQEAILNGDDSILKLIPANSLTSAEVLFGVYRNAYVGRLVEVVGNDHPIVAAYVGEERFDAMARAYIAKHPSTTQNARWVSRHLPAFLREDRDFRDEPDIADLATLEAQLSNAFDGADADALTIADLQRFPPESWDMLVFSPDPTAVLLELSTNAYDIWLAIKDGAAPPEAVDRPAKVLVWRHDVMPMTRRMEAEEAMMWTEAARGVRFGVLCEMIATYDDPETAPLRAAQYLQGWLMSGALSGAAPAKRPAKRRRQNA